MRERERRRVKRLQAFGRLQTNAGTSGSRNTPDMPNSESTLNVVNIVEQHNRRDISGNL